MHSLVDDGFGEAKHRVPFVGTGNRHEDRARQVRRAVAHVEARFRLQHGAAPHQTAHWLGQALDRREGVYRRLHQTFDVWRGALRKREVGPVAPIRRGKELKRERPRDSRDRSERRQRRTAVPLCPTARAVCIGPVAAVAALEILDDPRGKPWKPEVLIRAEGLLGRGQRSAKKE